MEFGRKVKGEVKKSKGDKLFGELFWFSIFLCNELYLYVKSMLIFNFEYNIYFIENKGVVMFYLVEFWRDMDWLM